MTRTCVPDSFMIRPPCLDLDGARRRGNLLFFIGTHACERRFRDAQFQEEVSFERQPLRQRRLSGVADEPLDVSNRFRRKRRQVPCDLHRAIEGLAADGFVHQALPFGFTRTECLTHENVHERGWGSDGAWQPLSAAGAGKETKLCLRQSDQVFAILSDTKIASQRELESAGQGRPGNSGDYWFWHALAQRHCLIEESPIVGRVLGPLAAGSAQGLGDLDKRRNTKMTIEITGRPSSNDDNANLSVAREMVQRLGERVAHLSIEVDALWAAQCNDRNSVGHFCRQNIGVHRVLLTCNALFFLCHFYTDIFRSKQFAVAIVAQNSWFSHQLTSHVTTSNGYTPLQSCSNLDLRSRKILSEAKN